MPPTELPEPYKKENNCLLDGYVRLVPSIGVVATKLGAVAKCVFVELLHGCRGGWSEIKSFHRLEVSSLVLYTGGSGGIASSSPSGIEIFR